MLRPKSEKSFHSNAFKFTPRLSVTEPPAIINSLLWIAVLLNRTKGTKLKCSLLVIVKRKEEGTEWQQPRWSNKLKEVDRKERAIAKQKIFARWPGQHYPHLLVPSHRLMNRSWTNRISSIVNVIARPLINDYKFSSTTSCCCLQNR